MREISKLLDERAVTHGNFIKNGLIMQQLKQIARIGDSWDTLRPYQREALEMILHKVGRVVNGDSTCVDHWVDISGYAQLVVKELQNGDS